MDKNIINQVKNFISEKDMLWFDSFIENLSTDIETLNQIFFIIYEHTNSFRNANTSKELMIITSRLLEKWVIHDKIIVEKTKTNYDKMKLFWEVLSKIVKNEKWNIIWATLDKKLFDKFSIDFFSLNELIDQLLFSIKDVEVIFFCISGDEKLKIIRYKNKKTKKLQELVCIFERDLMTCNLDLQTSCTDCCNN